jgi:hypothetical protein
LEENIFCCNLEKILTQFSAAIVQKAFYFLPEEYSFHSLEKQCEREGIRCS